MTKNTTSSKVHLCAQPPAVPLVLPQGLVPEREYLIRKTKNKWVGGTVLRYYFLESSDWNWPDAQKDVVRWAFNVWKAEGISLVFRETDDESEAEIRIGFLQDGRSWSYVGTDILKYQDRGRTMNFGWDLTTAWGHATALHEIGHTLGMPHEHQNPLAGIVWDEEKVYAEFADDPNNWDRETTYQNIIRKIPKWEVEGSNWDPVSIMHYPFDPGLIKAPKPYDKNGIPNNTVLSQQDKDWVRRFYPVGSEPLPITPLQLERLGRSGEQRDFVFEPAATREYKIQTVGVSDCKIVVFEERNGEPRHMAAEDDSGSDGNALIATKLIKGRRYLVRVRVHYVSSPDGAGLLIT